MAKNNVGEWDTTAANNTDVGGISIAEGMSPGNVNNAMREMMAQLVEYRGAFATRTAANATSAAALANGTVVMIDGYLYEVDSTATGANSATNDLSVNGLVPFGVVTPMHFGATGDGTTDDTAAIKAAITKAGTDGHLHFPAGTYVFGDDDADGVGLTMLSGQKWSGEGPEQSILLLDPTTTDIDVCITAANFADGCILEDLQVNGNRSNITPATDLYNTFYLIRGARGALRSVYRNLILSNSWGRVLQTSNESVTEYATDILVENVKVVNAGTKAISVTQSKRVTVSNCYAEVDPYAAAQHGGADDATSGSCFEVNDGIDVVIKGCHGVQSGSSIAAPGIRLINGSSDITVTGNTIDSASYLGFIQNVNQVEFFGNRGRDIRGNGILIADSDVSQAEPCRRIRVHHNTLYDVDDAYVLIQANKSGTTANVECYVYENTFVQDTGTPTSGINNAGVASPATGGTCFVYAWGNNFWGTIPNKLAGAAADEVRGQPKSGGWEILEQSSVAASHTGDTSETNLAVVTIPANSMGPNGRLRVTALWSYTNSANNKTTRIRFSGAQAYASVNTTTDSQRAQIEICNRNSASSQVAGQSGGLSGFGLSSAVGTASVDTTANVNLQISGQLASAGETITLESYIVEIHYAD